MKQLWFFYGTLRLGDASETWGTSENDLVEEGVTVPGAMWTREFYPVVDFTWPGKVVGDVYEFDVNDPRLRQIAYTEVHAGYIPIIIESGLMWMLTWQFNMTKQRSRDMTVINHGDWLRYARESVGTVKRKARG